MSVRDLFITSLPPPLVAQANPIAAQNGLRAYSSVLEGTLLSREILYICLDFSKFQENRTLPTYLLYPFLCFQPTFWKWPYYIPYGVQ